MKKFWVDIFNGPHVHFFQNVEKFIDPVLFTARDYKPIPELIELYRMPATIIGKHGGKDNYEKLRASLERAIKLNEFVKNLNIDFSMHKHSVEAARVAWGLGIPSISYIDNELMVPQNMLVCPLAHVLIAPIAINQFTLRNFTPSHVSILQFDGVCEVANVHGFTPDSNILKKLNLREDKPIILVRGEPILAAYNTKEGIAQNLINNIKKDVKDAQVVSFNRVGEKKSKNDAIMDALSLSYYADIVISGGGTMTREAALLGTRAISYFPTPLAVDRYLIKRGLLESYPGEQILQLNWSTELKKAIKKKNINIELDFEHPFALIDKAIKLIELRR